MSKTAIQIDDASADFIESQIRGGSYVTANEVVRAGLRLLEEHDSKVKALEEALVTGEQSGEPVALDFEAFKLGKRSAYQVSRD